MQAILRILAISILAVVVTLAIGYQYRLGAEARAQREIAALKAEMAARLAERDAMIDRLSRSRRVAHVLIGEQRLDADGDILETDVEFIELDDDGRQIGRQSFTIRGRVLFIDVWTARFSAEDVAHGHPLRGRSLVLLRRIYSDQIAPKDGFAIDTPGATPAGYAVGTVAQFERLLWEDFWRLASDPVAAARLGVRIAQGEVVYKPVRTGQAYEFIVDAIGGIGLIPLETGETYSRVP